MHLVVPVEGGIELNYTWLPTWLGMNQRLRDELVTELVPKVVGRPLTEETLSAIDDLVVDWFCRRFPMFPHLRGVFDALRQVQV